MAELNTGGGGDKKGGKVRSKKSDAKVDLTAMVDLAFLLITFFMLTTSLSKPKAMDLSLPDKEKIDKPEDNVKVDENMTLTLLLGANNKLKWYKGFIETPKAGPKDVNYGKDGLRKELLKQKAEIREYCLSINKPKSGIIVIIKPTDKSSYKNLIDILDEMAISGVDTYAIVNEISPEEKKLIGAGNPSATPAVETPETKK